MKDKYTKRERRSEFEICGKKVILNGKLRLFNVYMVFSFVSWKKHL